MRKFIQNNIGVKYYKNLLRFQQRLEQMLNYKIKFLHRHKDFTIISNNCIAGMLYKDFNLEFQSPTISLQFSQEDYVKFCKNIEYYLNQPLVEVKDPHLKKEQEIFSKIGIGDVNFHRGDINFPVGKIGDITLFFQHYLSFKDASGKWNSRKKRINFNQLFFVFVVYDSANEAVMSEFNALQYKNKIMLINRRITHETNVFRIENGNNTWYELCRKVPFFFRKYYQRYDFLHWFYSVLKNENQQ